MHYSWPGNVRELRAALEGAVVLSRGDRLLPRDLPANVRAGQAAVVSAAQEPALPATMRDAEKALIIRTLQEAAGNRSEAARRMGMSRRTLHRRLHEYGLESL